MKKRIYVISRLYGPLHLSIEKLSWRHTGIPAYYNFIKHIENDNRFDVKVIFLLDSSSSKKFKNGKYKIEGIQNKVRLIKYFSLFSATGVMKKIQWLINKLFQYSFLFFILKNNSIYYLDRDNILFGNILSFKKGLIVYRLLGIKKDYYDIFFNRGFLSKLFLRALKLKNKIIITTNDGSWSEKTKEDLNDKKFHVIYNGCDLKKKKIIPKIKDVLNITCVSRLEREKGYIELLDIIYQLKKRSIKFKLLIIGDGDLKEEIINKITNLGLSSDVELKGKVEHYKIEKYLELTDIFISFNHIGMFGNNVIEATSKGIPILALDNKILKSTDKKYFYIAKENCHKNTVDFIEKFSINLDLRIHYSNLSTMFFEKNIGNWHQRIKKELDVIDEN